MTPLGRRTQRLDVPTPPKVGIATNLFDYNPRSELISALMHTNTYSFTYDSIGNRLSASSSVHSVTSSVATFPCYDANGNITDLVDTNGTVAAHYQYDPYGNITAASGNEASNNPFRFSTKDHDNETDLVYYGYRYVSAL